MSDRSTIKGLISSIHGTVSYAISKGLDGRSWSITYGTFPNEGEQKIRLIRGFKRRKDAIQFCEEKLKYSLIGEVL